MQLNSASLLGIKNILGKEATAIFSFSYSVYKSQSFPEGLRFFENSTPLLLYDFFCLCFSLQNVGRGQTLILCDEVVSWNLIGSNGT